MGIEWKSVNEELPRPDELVLCCNVDYQAWWRGMYFPDIGEWTNCQRAIRFPTHWARVELPA
jgi:hypothetical protein